MSLGARQTLQRTWLGLKSAERYQYSYPVSFQKVPFCTVSLLKGNFNDTNHAK